MSLRPPFKLPGKPSWYYEINRTRRSLKTSDKAEATRLFNVIKREYLAGRIAQLTGECSKSLGDFSDEYLAWAESVQPKQTFRTNKKALGKLIEIEGRSVRLDRLTLKAIDRMRAKNTHYKASSINVYIRHLKSLFNKTVEWGYIKANPFRGAKQVPEGKRPPRFLTLNNVKTLLMKAKDDDALAIITAYLCTGRRRSELAALHWEDVDLAGRRYYVHQKKVHLSAWFPANDGFMAVLNAVPESERAGFVFKRWRHPDTITHVVKNVLREAGLGNFHLHHLRHSFAALFIEAGGGLRVLQDLLGHQQYRTTEIYAHVHGDHLQEAVNMVKIPSVLRVIK
jgi:integrase